MTPDHTPTETPEETFNRMRKIATFKQELCELYHSERNKIEQKDSGWISVKDLLPEEETDILFYSAYDNEIQKGYLSANQYRVICLYKGEETSHECFLRHNNYYISRNTRIDIEHIKSIEKIG